MSIEDLNYYNDRRVCERAQDPELDGEKLPYIWEVCPVCDGEGKHVNPSIDAGGLSAEDFHDDPDFLNDYMGGVYDIPCNCCGGRTTVKMPDFDRMTEDQVKRWKEECEMEAYLDAEQRAERAMGC